MKIKLIKFQNNLIKPTRAHYNDAGIDCYAQEDIELEPIKVGQEIKPVYENIPIKYEMCEDGISIKPIEYNYSKVGEDIVLYGETIPTLIPLGFGLEVPDGYMATIRPRSSYNVKGVISQIGTIDSGYRGEIKAVLINLTSKPISIKKGEKICQIVIEPVILADFVEDLTNDRGEGGFGSTGK